MAYATRLERRETEKILKAVNLPVDIRHRGTVRTKRYVPPPVQKKPGMAAVALRQDVLQVKVLLTRAKPSKAVMSASADVKDAAAFLLSKAKERR